MKKVILLLCLLVLLIGATPVLAADVSSAIFSGIITITNNSTAASNVATIFTGNTTAWIANGLMNYSANNTAILSASGADVAFMPGLPGYPWCIFVPSIGASTSQNDILYMGGTSNMSPKLGVFANSNGIIIADNATLEMSDNFSIELSGWFDTDLSSANTTYYEKLDAISIYNGATDNIVAEIPAIQGTQIANFEVDNSQKEVWGVNWRSQVFNSGNTSGEIYSVWLKLDTNGAPADNVTVSIRAVNGATGKPTGSDLMIGSRSCASIVAKDWYEFIMSGFLSYSSSTQYALVLRATSGTGAADSIDWQRDTGDGYPSGWDGYSNDSGATWLLAAANDNNFRVYNAAHAYVSAGGYSSDEYDVVVSANTTHLQLFIDGVEVDNDALDGASVVDNANNIGIVMTYVTSIDHYVGGNHRSSIRWAWGSVLPDLTGSGNAASFTPRSASSDADVSASLASFAPVSEADAPAYVLSSAPDFYTNTPAMSGNFSVGVGATYPGHTIITEIAASAAVPEQLPTVIFATMVILIFSIGVSYMMIQGRENSLFIQMCVIAGIMCIFVAVKIFDPWQVYFFVLIGLALCWLSRENTGNIPGGGYAGTITMLGWWFLNMTLINRVLEGQFITSNDMGVVNQLSIFRQITLFGYIPVPIPNLSMLTSGIGRLLKTDYSFFGGQAGYFQYGLYAITFGVAFMLFVIIVASLISNFLNRVR